MQQRIAVLALALLIASVLLAAGFEQQGKSTLAKDQALIPSSMKAVADQESKAALPLIQARIDDLGTSPVDLLRHLPGVVQVEVGVPSEKPTCRVVHLRDWHFVPRNLFAIDIENATHRQLTTDEIDRQYQEFLEQVDAVQLEQMELLRCLIKGHGLKHIYLEGLTAGDRPDYEFMIALLRDTEETQSDLRQQLADARAILQKADPNTEQHKQAQKIEAETAGMIDRHRLLLLKVGAPGRLLIGGEIEEVLPLDDADLLDNANPVTSEGKIEFDAEKLKARHDAQVRAVLANGGFGLIVLGGAHNLSESVRRLGHGRCEYIRVRTRRYTEFAEGRPGGKEAP
jgi:hypothetical protein